MFIDIKEGIKGWRFWSPIATKDFVSREARFHENVFLQEWCNRRSRSSLDFRGWPTSILNNHIRWNLGGDIHFNAPWKKKIWISSSWSRRCWSKRWSSNSNTWLWGHRRVITTSWKSVTTSSTATTITFTTTRWIQVHWTTLQLTWTSSTCGQQLASYHNQLTRWASHLGGGHGKCY